MKPRQLDDIFERLDEVACHAASIPPYKQLSEETRLAQNYLKNVMSRLIRIRRTGVQVPRETLLRSLSNEKEFDLLMDRLNKRKALPPPLPARSTKHVEEVLAQTT